MQGKKRRLYTASTGLNTITDPTRINFDPETGISDLGVAVNVQVDQTGWIGRRKGYTRLQVANAHSLFCDKGLCLYVADNKLYELLPGYNTVLLRDDLVSNEHMSYAQVNQDIYYSNGTDLGIVRSNSTLESWTANAYVGQTTNQVFDGPRAGNHLAYFAGRMFVAEDDVLWWSEPYAFSWFNRSKNFVQFASRILMVKPVDAGIFLSDSENTYFLPGHDPKEFQLKKISQYPAFEWSEAIDLVEGWEIGLTETDPGLCALWSSPEGACLGTALGFLVNLNKLKVIYPEVGTYGAGILTGYHFIQTIGG